VCHRLACIGRESLYLANWFDSQDTGNGRTFAGEIVATL
jgi:hypothetical protein